MSQLYRIFSLLAIAGLFSCKQSESYKYVIYNNSDPDIYNLNSFQLPENGIVAIYFKNTLIDSGLFIQSKRNGYHYINYNYFKESDLDICRYGYKPADSNGGYFVYLSNDTVLQVFYQNSDEQIDILGINSNLVDAEGIIKNKKGKITSTFFGFIDSMNYILFIPKRHSLNQIEFISEKNNTKKTTIVKQGILGLIKKSEFPKNELSDIKKAIITSNTLKIFY